MGKIKGWTKVNETHWKSNGTHISIDKRPDINWRVQIHSTDWSGVIKRVNLTKEQAKAFAVNYMKAHPRG